LNIHIPVNRVSEKISIFL